MELWSYQLGAEQLSCGCPMPLCLPAPQVCDVLRPDGEAVVLIKPQFEAEKEQVGGGQASGHFGTHTVCRCRQQALQAAHQRAEGASWSAPQPPLPLCPMSLPRCFAAAGQHRRRSAGPLCASAGEEARRLIWCCN